MSNVQKTCLVKFGFYFGIGVCLTNVEYQRLFAVLAIIEVMAATNPWLKTK